MKTLFKIKQLNHVAIQISDVERSRIFYSEILGLKEIEPPAFSYPVVWYDLGEGRQLHLIARLPEKDFVPIKSNHFALEVDNIHLIQAYFEENKVNFLPLKPRPDGVLQLFFNDPDGNFIEFCQFL